MPNTKQQLAAILECGDELLIHSAEVTIDLMFQAIALRASSVAFRKVQKTHPRSMSLRQ